MSFDEYLRTLLKDKSNNSQQITHTRIPGQNVYGGSYYIPLEKKEEFYRTYYEKCYLQGIEEHLTEKQIQDDMVDLSGNKINGPILIDFDFRYNKEIITKQHSQEHIEEIVCLYINQLKTFFAFKNEDKFNIYILEKPNINKNSSEYLNKDGLHIIIGIQCDHIIQRLLRTKMLEILSQNEILKTLPLINTWDEVLDEGITKGHTNWQLYGSCKPGNETYEIKYVYEITYDETDGEFCLEETPILKLKSGKIKKDLFMKLTAQYENHPIFPLQASAITAKNNYCQITPKRSTSNPRSIHKNIIMDEILDANNTCELYITQHNSLKISDIKSEKDLDDAIQIMLNSFKQSHLMYDLCEIHDFALILPDIFYKPGSHDMNRRLAFALKNTDDRMFLTWIKVRSKASDFEYSSITKLYNEWKKYFNQNNKDEKTMMTKKSIIFWAKTYCPDKFEEIKKSGISNIVDFTLKNENGATDYDIAKLLYYVYKDEYLFVINGNSSDWYRFVNHHWELEPKGTALRKNISDRIYNLYSQKQTELMNERMGMKISSVIDVNSDQNESQDVSELEIQNKEKNAYLNKKLKCVGKILSSLKSTSSKNNIMREAQDLFLDRDFEKKRDENKFLMGFKNGVYDFSEKCFRDGKPEDFITLCTNINYKEIDKEDAKDKKMMAEINEIISRIYPNPELCKYMWEHWASFLIGVNLNQTINFYLGNGSNGKSIITILLKAAFGNYGDKCSIQLITDERGKLGAATPEYAKLKGLRFVYMSEPRKGAVLNEGTMKEITGDGDLEARELYKGIITFSIQCKFIALMNSLLEVKAADDGTWRRLRVCQHESKFAFLEEMEQATKENKYVFERDPMLESKIVEYAPYFMSMLVEIVNRTAGRVTDCDVVLSASKQYRKNQDFVCAFLSEKIEKTGDKKDKIKQTELFQEFKRWYSDEHSVKVIPVKSHEIYEAMSKKYGQAKNNSWLGVKIKYEYDTDDEDEV